MWKWQKPSLVTIWKDLAFSIPSSSFDYVHTFRLQYCHHRRRQALVRGIVAPSWPKNSFILTIETTKNRGWAPRHHLKTIKWLTSPREPSLGKFLPTLLTVVIGITSSRLVPRAWAGIFPGRGSRQVQEKASSHFSHCRIRFLVALMVKMKEFSGQRDIALPCQWLPAPMACTDISTNKHPNPFGNVRVFYFYVARPSIVT